MAVGQQLILKVLAVALHVHPDSSIHKSGTAPRALLIAQMGHREWVWLG